MPASDSLAHLTELLLMLGSFVNLVQDYRQLVPVQDKAKALLFFADKGDPSAYGKVLSAIRYQKEQAEQRLSYNVKAEKGIEAAILNDRELLEKNPDFAARLVARIASRQGDVKIKQQMRPVLKKHIEGRVKEEQAFTRVYRMLAKERQSGLKPPSLLT